MRYLFGSLMVLAVLAFAACGDSDGNCVERVDVAGEWEMTTTDVIDSCGGRVPYTFPVTITQNGNALTAEFPGGTLTGTVCGDQVRLSGSFPEDDGTVTVSVALIVSADGDSMQGSDSWSWTDGFTDCSGSDSLSGTRMTAQEFPCTEQGIRDAIAQGGGPHTFDCDGPQTVVTKAGILIDNDVILDGGGNLLIDGKGEHRVLNVPQGATVTLDAITIIHGNHEEGGGIYNAGTLTLTNSTVTENWAEHGGGIRSRGPLTLMNSTISGNDATDGGGVFHSQGDLTVINTTVSGNTAERGGGIYTVVEGTLTLISSTLWNNVAREGRAFWGGGPVVIWNSLIEGDCEYRYSAHPRGGNIESPGDTCVFLRANVAPEALKLGPLQDNGGPAFTHLPGPDSIAIDFIDRQHCADANGLPIATDQRGVERPNGPSCDVGAVEAPSPCEDLHCDDQNVCTWNRCDPVERTCSHPRLPEGEQCAFDETPMVCRIGACIEDLCARDPCDDNNDCTADVCDWVDGSCTNTPVEDGQRCSLGLGAGGTGGAPLGYCLDGVCY